MWFLIIILLLLFLFFSPVIKVWRAVRKFQDEYNRTMDQASQNQDAAQKNDKQNELKERYRRYTDETGEDVSFEEVKGRPNDNETTEQQPSSGSSSKYQDEVVSDAEFEEI
ncbi:MAG: hypothetical protein J6X22_05935 [Muribaculaceae bacterium]|nr:hypothetical protein [Muribaculaceae bacterium]